MVGDPGAGKTALAAHLAARNLDRPVVVVDSLRAGDWDRMRHVERVEELADLWRAEGAQGRVAAITPADSAEVDLLSAAVLAAGDATVLVDEASVWLGRGRSSGLVRLMRMHRHSRLTVLATTQHFTGDIPAEALSCSPWIYVFRTKTPRVLDCLQRRYDLDPDEVQGLDVGECLEITGRQG